MKKIIISIALLFLTSPVFSEPVISPAILAQTKKPIEAQATFDWISKSQLNRDENIKIIQDQLPKDTVLKYSKKDFKTKYADYLKNKNYMKDYEDISKGKKEDNDKIYCGFYVGKLLIAYGIQYKKHTENVYYYDAMGNLRWVDVFSSNYPKFPYCAFQYYRNGELIAIYYYASRDDQYVFAPDKSFSGRWFKDKLYSRKAKVIMTRSNW